MLKINKIDSEQKKKLLFYGSLFATLLFGFLLLNYYFPKTCDDITYSLINQPSVLKLLPSALVQGNGRLFGNFLCYLVSYTNFVILEKTVVWFGIVFFAMKIIGSKNMVLNTAVAIGLIFPCDTLFAQVYAWSSGFQNYVVPAFIILFDIFLIKKLLQFNGFRKVCACIVLFLTALAGQFFSENTSLFAFCLAVLLLFYCIKYNKNMKAYAVTYITATFSGFVLMMTYPKILGTGEKIASYRHMADSLDSLFSMALKNFRLISKEFASYFILWVVVSFAFVLLIQKLLDSVGKRRFMKYALNISKVIIAIYPVFCFFYAVIAENSITFLRYYFNYSVCFSLIIYIAVIIFVSFLILSQKDLSEKEKLPVMMILLSLFSILPLLIVSPIGARTFYIIFVFMFLSGMMIINNNIKQNININALKSCCCILFTVCLLSVLVMAEMDNSYCNTIRNSYLADEIQEGSDEITLPLLPHQNLVHEDDNENTWQNYIKRKYKTEAEISFVDWNQWYEDYYKKSS